MRLGLLALALALGGCGSHAGDEATLGCLVDSSEPVTDPAEVPSGFTASVQAMLDRVVGSFSGTVTHADDTTAELQWDVTQDGDVVVERRSLRDDGGGSGIEPAFALDCLDDVSIPVVVTLTSGTALDESLSGAVSVDTTGAGSFFASVDLDDLQGDAVPYGFDPSTMAQTTFQVSATASDEGWTGELSFTGESPPSGPGPDSSVSATLDPWGTFDVAP